MVDHNTKQPASLAIKEKKAVSRQWKLFCVGGRVVELAGGAVWVGGWAGYGAAAVAGAGAVVGAAAAAAAAVYCEADC